ncbi:MAG: peptidase [Phyllobacteriaceae bacterium]|jgi:prepilin peptidase CpaA|nr:peptidase [Phyllobacteriaceae bacterium]
MIQTLSTALLPILMIVAALSDLTSFRIPNWLTGLTALLFFPMAWLTGMPLGEFGWHLLAGGILFAAGFALFSFGVFGGGDAKMMAAAGLWFGTAQTMPFLVATVFAGGILAAAVALWSMFMAVVDIHGPNEDAGLVKVARKIKPKLPYGFALAVGAIVTYPHTWWMAGGA